ncbi:patatin-like phospholipase family protein [Nocardia cyriacigeorgica]|uniref:patatin-like phospholipase family protein n=1 Tax=Nocardia cyriacigeorgica TaxID=135487 RepID=UPI00189492B8|nr:patatin-like phospholipase family protein [Nocardia cyriacigeorgica]MBF6412940.1 patatin-like phospholipase family protein [Nocardia cyriacigeorgica]
MTTRALVIGCGGTIGAAWIVAALAALAEQLDWDPRTADLMQGTSAGAELITLLASGVGVDELVRMQQGTAHDKRLRAHHDHAPASLPPLPSPRLLKPAMLRSQHGLAALAGIAPIGRGDPSWLARLAVNYTHGKQWLDHPAARMVALDIDSGQRVAFGAPGAPVVFPEAALRASWAVPGWLPPVTVDGRTYIDGGAASTASLDLLIDHGFDEIYLISPMASPDRARIPGVGGFLEDRCLRRPMTEVLTAEIAAVQATGTRVIAICPRATDLANLPANFMNRGARHEAFAASMRTARSTVAKALTTVTT